MNQFFKFISAFFLILILSACSSSKQAAIKESPLPEVLMAHDCGFDKLKCCEDKPSCKYGQKCCQDPNNSENNYCADECGCGQLDEFCCSDNICKENLRCSEGKCVECGNKSQKCCKNETICNDGLICHNDECLECGVEGNPCCETGKKCSFENEMNEDRTECINGGCKKCGSNGLLACLSQPNCLAGHLFNNGYCFRCGDINQPCCDNKLATGYICNSDKNLKCDKGFCGSIK